MDAIDTLIKNAESKGDKIVSLNKDNPERNELANTLPQDYDDILVNLARLIDMANLFIDRKFNEIISKQYKRNEYTKWRPNGD